MNPRLRWLLTIGVIALVVVILAQYFRTGATHAAGPAGMVGQRAPIFALRDDHGDAVSLTRYRGRVVVLNLWASWCPPCRAEMPDLQRLQRAFATRGVIVVGINQGESAAHARAFAHSLGVVFPIWIDDRQQYGRVFAALGLPTTIIISRNGMVVRGFDGALTLGQMQAAVKPFLARNRSATR